MVAAVGLIGPILSAGVGLIGGIMQGQSAAAAARYQAGVARNNQIIAEQNAQYATAAGAAQAQARDFRNKAVLGQITAAQSVSGIDTESTTSREVRDAAAQVGRLDTENVMSNALLQARGMQQQSANFGAQAQLDTMQGQSAASAGYLKGLSSLVGGASSFAAKWLRYQDEGVTF